MAIVSIIVPSYNSAYLISTTLKSILQSTYQDYEVLIIDDGSTDNTKMTVESYLKDKRFKYIYQQNKGLAGARNTGIKHAQGKYLVFLDSDDVILPGKLQKQVDYLESFSEIDIVYSNSEWFVEDNLNNTIPVTFPVYEGDILQFLLFGNFIHVNAAMVRTDVVKAINGFDECFRELEDWDLWMRLSINGSAFGHIPKVLSKVRIRKGSMTSDQVRMNKAMVRVLEKNIPNLKNRETAIVNRALHALYLYRLKAMQTTGFINDLIKTTKQQGSSFLPVTLKMGIKYLMYPFIKSNKGLKELELVWDRARH